MAKVSTYLNFLRTTEEAFEFYKSVFKTEFARPIMRYGDGPGCPEGSPISEADKNLVMHVSLPILGGHVLMGSDAPDFMSGKFVAGTNVSINLEPDTRAEAERLFKELSEGGTVEMPLRDMFWGAYFACFTDKFGTNWMINCESKE